MPEGESKPRSGSPQLLSRVGDVIPQIIHQIYGEVWPGLDYDARLYRTLASVLDILHASACVVIDGHQKTAVACAALLQPIARGSSVTLHRVLDRNRKQPASEATTRTIEWYEEEYIRIAQSLLEREICLTGYHRLTDENIAGLPVDYAVTSSTLGSRRTVETRPSASISSVFGAIPLERPTSLVKRSGLFCYLFFHGAQLDKILTPQLTRGTNAYQEPGSKIHLGSGPPREETEVLQEVSAQTKSPESTSSQRSALDHQKQTKIDQALTTISNTVLPLLLETFRYYESRFAAFPGRIQAHYWQQIAVRLRPALNQKLGTMPPWDYCAKTQKNIPTVTLSLDLRKSTYCMDYAASDRRFGQWLEMFSEKMRSVTHSHGGVYDKFTGDGCLIHFLDHECQSIFGRSAVDAAVHCAADMQRVVERHLADLRSFLHHDAPEFGAGIAIDIEEAYWACDDRDNPVVVGRGVVGACRVGDGAPRGTIRLTNLAYRMLTPSIRERLPAIQKKDFKTKESTGGMTLQCWQFNARQADGLGWGFEAMKELCKNVYVRFRKEPEQAANVPEGSTGLADLWG